MQTLKIALFQSDLHWENPAANRLRFEGWFDRLEADTQLVVLPEMFTTGFTTSAAARAHCAEPADDSPTLAWMRRHAARLGAMLMGSAMVRDTEGLLRNRFWAVSPDGSVSHYDKRHLFGMESGEREHFAAGQQRTVIVHAGWRICLMVCYDLRFPVWSRQRADYDALVYVANWPKTRIAHWQTLLQARAIENQCYVVGGNRVGTDGAGLVYSGDSMAVSPLGVVMAHRAEGAEGILYAELDAVHLATVRQKLPFLEDADAFAWQ